MLHFTCVLSNYAIITDTCINQNENRYNNVPLNVLFFNLESFGDVKKIYICYLKFWDKVYTF